MGTVTYTDELTIIECGECGITFGMTKTFVRERKKDHRTWYCPNGHRRYYSAENEEEKLRRELAATEGRLAEERARTRLAKTERDTAEARRRAEKAAKTRLKKRISNGVCPCCKRSFKNLHDHMANQHPDYVEGD